VKKIYFSGPDGSGKTTSLLKARDILIDEGRTVFSLRTLQVARLFYVFKLRGLPGGSAVDSLGNIGRLGASELKRDRRQETYFYKIRRWIGLIVALVDCAIFGRLMFLWLSHKYDVVLVEESPSEIFIKRHRPFYPKTFYLLALFLPQPDLVVRCVADPKRIANRKPELTFSELEEYYISLRYVLKFLKWNVLDNFTNFEDETNLLVLNDVFN